MVKIFIDDKELEVSNGLTILRAAEGAGIPIPHFCYHPAFAPEGSCRMCLVEISGLPKLELACSTVVREGMKILTASEKVIEARKAVLEFLLAEHPLDCPICDKAGECKLQDYFEEYGFFASRFKEAKEKREKKVQISKNLILDRERCILCTRCLRFLSEITKTQDVGVLNRGIHSEIAVYESNFIDNHYAGNLAELCPVGAITDTDFRFKTRAWFLVKKESICPMCSRGCNIFIDSHPGFARTPLAQRVYRIRARENQDINSFWICDFGRYHYSYIDQGRQERIVLKKEAKDTELSWEKALIILAEKVKSLVYLKKKSRIGVILNTWLTNEELYLADKVFKKGLGLENIYVVDPPSEKGDDFLLTEERTPNRRGLKEVGLPDLTPDLGKLALQTDLLLIFGTFLVGRFSVTELKSAFDKIGTKFLFAAHKSALDSLVDVVIPTPLIAEKGGSLTNVNGKVQSFSPALDNSLGLPEWKLLIDLAKELKINHKPFWQLSSPQAILEEMGRGIPFFK
ncbi:MAG: 2Fe-2S iron-sulfur cluster-binding protein [Clostridiales bacterium]|nr:2Fe-2S iron-sulfur cluster-binding protein [Clostridiales bacterium]